MLYRPTNVDDALQMTIVIDDKIKRWSDCKFMDGKLCIVFKEKDSFGTNIADTMENLISLL